MNADMTALLDTQQGMSARSADEVRACIRRILHPDVQLLTLTGAPGVGKTYLATAAAAALDKSLPHGAVVAELAELENWVVFLAAVAEALDLPDSDRSLWSIKESLQAYLRDKTMLLVLDTFEHIMPAAPSVRFLLEACPQLTVVVTSRQPLGLEGEQTFEVTPLPLPDLAQPETLPYNESVALFARCAEIAPDLLASGTLKEEVAQLCHRLDGLPLAIIAAARQMKRTSPKALLGELETPDYLRVWAMAAHDEHHRTLFEAVRWSYVRLSGTERRVLRAASAIPNTFGTAQLAPLLRHIAQARGAPSLDDTALTSVLEQLRDKHLLEPAPREVGEEPAYTLLAVVRAYLQLEVDAEGEREVLEAYSASQHIGLGLETSRAVQAAEPTEGRREAPAAEAAGSPQPISPTPDDLSPTGPHLPNSRAPSAPPNASQPAETSEPTAPTSSDVPKDISGVVDAPASPTSFDVDSEDDALFLADALTERELEVLQFVAQGLSNREVAERLDISHRTVSTHLSNVYSKLNVRTRTAAVTRAQRLRLI